VPRHELYFRRDRFHLQRPHGRWHDLARAPTVAPTFRRVAVARI